MQNPSPKVEPGDSSADPLQSLSGAGATSDTTRNAAAGLATGTSLAIT